MSFSPQSPEALSQSERDLDRFLHDCLPEFQAAIRKGSIGFLSTIKGSLLQDITRHPDEVFDDFATDSVEYYAKYPELKSIKDDFFNYNVKEIQDGESHLIPQLAKGVTDEDSLALYLRLMYDYSSVPDIDKNGTELLIYPGSFDPMHYGHRIMIASLLGSTPDSTRLAVNMNSYQARKRYLEETYERRFANLEYKLLKSAALDPLKVCAMDFRFGTPSDTDYMFQTRMQSFMAGDARTRWVIGGDKFLSEVDRSEKEIAEGRAGRSCSRFSLDDMSIYIVPRKGQDIVKFRDLTSEHNERYKAQFILREEKGYDGDPISSTIIRKYREEGDTVRADQMENFDLKRDYRYE